MFSFHTLIHSRPFKRFPQAESSQGEPWRKQRLQGNWSQAVVCHEVLHPAHRQLGAELQLQAVQLQRAGSHPAETTGSHNPSSCLALLPQPLLLLTPLHKHELTTSFLCANGCIAVSLSQTIKLWKSESWSRFAWRRPSASSNPNADADTRKGRDLQPRERRRKTFLLLETV